MVFGSDRIRIDKGLLERVKQAAERAGYATVEEFVSHVLEKELSNLEQADSEAEIKKRLEGLGYIS